MRESADLARDLGVQLHTHLAETRDEEAFCLATFGLRPIDYAESVGWLADDVWFAHAVFVSDADIALMVGSRTGAAHCPTSNMRLSSGAAPLSRFLDAGVPVGLGVDGSASNDTSHLMAEARRALLVARLMRALEQTDGLLDQEFRRWIRSIFQVHAHIVGARGQRVSQRRRT
jgi:cytosine/adenosine deaminase-related metal-dependent hydrolase